jgi:hypothetical protein
MSRPKMLVGSLAALAVLASTACSLPASAADQQVQPAPSHASTRTGSFGAKVSTEPSVVSRSSAPGGSRSSTRPVSMSDKTTQVHMQFTNSSDEVLHLVSASRGGATAHWAQQPPTTIQPHAAGFASSYAASNAQISLVYQGADDGVQFTLFAETYTVGPNKTEGKASSASYLVTTDAGSGYNPTYAFNMTPGQTFAPTNRTDTFTVPGGVTQLYVSAAGGPGGFYGGNLDNTAASGAQISGTFSVTPGEVLTVAVGGSGEFSLGADGGWGMPTGSSSYSGGSSTGSGSGGGATVLLDPSGNAIVVAGGGGGAGSGPHPGDGGRGGYQGNLTGENGGGGLDIGGLAGALDRAQGQTASSSGSSTPGAGGGGVHGGQAGVTATSGGGGAGASSDAGLYDPTVESAPRHGSAVQAPGGLTLIGTGNPGS